jgi:hypothetical protein
MINLLILFDFKNEKTFLVYVYRELVQQWFSKFEWWQLTMVPVPVSVQISFRFRFQFKILCCNIGLIPVSAKFSVPVDHYFSS